MNLATLGMRIQRAEVDAANRSLQNLGETAGKVEGSAGRMGLAFGEVGRDITRMLAAAAGFHRIVETYRDLTRATIAGEQSAAKLAAVLQATGFAAGRTAQQINELSGALARSTLFDDDKIRDTAAVLATFRNVQGRVFDDALRAITDLSQVLGQDLQSSAIQVGKALNDPIRGVTALRRVGVQLSEQQEEQIRQFTRVGDLARAQGVILGELSMEFGGAAGAANAGLAGAIASARKEYDNFLESLGRTQQVGGTIQKFFRGWAEFWRRRELTTEPLEDLVIKLDNAASAIRRLESAGKIRAPQAPWWRDIIGAGETGDQALDRWRAIRTATQAQIDVLKLKEAADERAATAAAGAAALEAELNEQSGRLNLTLEQQAKLWQEVAKAMAQARVEQNQADWWLKGIIREFNRRPLPGWDPFAPPVIGSGGPLPPQRPGFWQQNRGQVIGAGLNIAADIGRGIGGPVGGALAGAAGGFAFGGPVGAAIGGFTGLISGILGAAAAARKAAEEFRQFQRSIEQSLQQALVEIIGGPLEQALEANRRFFESMRDEINQAFIALPAGKRQAAVDAVNTQLAETLRLEQLRAAQLEADHAREQERTREDLAVRLLRATGMQREADVMALAIEQERELTDAIRDHADAATIAVMQIVQAAEQLRQQLETRVAGEITTLDLWARFISAGGFLGSDVTVRQRQDMVFAIEQWKEMTAAVLAGADAATIALLEQVQLAEAEQRRAELLRQERMMVEDLNIRLLRAAPPWVTQAWGVDVDEMAFALAQQREYEDAVRSGADATTLALLKEVQLWEARRRQADAIEEQIAALVDQAEQARRTAQMLRDFGQEAALGIASPATRLMSTRSAFLDLVGTLRGGNLSDINRLPELARAFLDASRAYNASSLGFVLDTRLVEGITSEFADLFEGQASAAERQISALEDIRDILLERLRPTDPNPPGPPEDAPLYIMTQAGFVELVAQVDELTIAVQQVRAAIEAQAA